MATEEIYLSSIIPRSAVIDDVDLVGPPAEVFSAHLLLDLDVSRKT